MRPHPRYPLFDLSRIRTYPLADRTNKVKLADLVRPDGVLEATYEVGAAGAAIAKVADAVVEARRAGRPVIWFMGAHLVKNGLSPLVADLVERGVLTLVATNGAGTIHDFELALVGETSEHVPNALGRGQFGMAREFQYINAALGEGHARCMGYGESLGALICDAAFRAAVEARMGLDAPIAFRYPEVSYVARCWRMGVPVTVHVGIGSDVIDQHPNFDGAAKGGCSGRDFLIFAQSAAGLAGGVFLNVGSAVMGPEVLLKAVSMAANVGCPPTGLVTADFDLKAYDPGAMTDERSAHYYNRDHKSVAIRVPQSFGGVGHYVQGDQRATVPRLYQEIVRRLGAAGGVRA